MSGEPQKDEAWAEERKGGVRIETEMWVRVIGRDSEPIRRTGNICAGGFFFEAERTLVELQSAQPLSKVERRMLMLSYAKMGRWERLPAPETKE